MIRTPRTIFSTIKSGMFDISLGADLGHPRGASTAMHINTP
jgi:hypothetical protein